MPPKTDLKSLLNARDYLMTRIRHIESAVENIAPQEDETELQMFLERLSDLYGRFEEIQMKLEASDSGLYLPEGLAAEALYLKLSKSIRAALHKVESKIKEKNSDRDSPQVNSRANNPSLALPHINLPTFSGVYAEWPSFKDLFVNLIHNNEELSKAKKFYYLKGSLKKDAAALIANIECSEKNYESAWQTIVDRFDNKVLIANSHLRGIFELQKVSKNSGGLRKLITDFSQHYNSLKTLELPNLLDVVLVHIISQKLDIESLREFELQRDAHEFPSIETFLEYLGKRCQAWEMVARNETSSGTKVEAKIERKSLSYAGVESKGKDKVENDEMSADSCKAGRSKEEVASEKVAAHVGLNVQCLEVSGSKEMGVISSGNSICVLLSTAVLNVEDDLGSSYSCRALLDSASERNFVTSDLVRKIGIAKRASNWEVSGIGGQIAPVHYMVNLLLRSRVGTFEINTEFGVLDRIPENLPRSSFRNTLVKWPSFVALADPKFNVSSPIDMLIGAELFYNLLLKGKIDLGIGNLVLQNTKLGWIFGGAFNVGSELNCLSVCHTGTVMCAEENLNETMVKFWQTEEFAPKVFLSSEEKRCEKMFVESISRDVNGRYELDLPIVEAKLPTLGDSYDCALRCFLSLERRFKRDPEFFRRYQSCIQEFVKLGHAHEIRNFPSLEGCEYYLPHHAVLKENSSTTKLRVVFNASAKTSSGVSLNDVMMVGPVVQPDLFTVLLRFRTYIYCIITDIAKMYRQIKVKKKYQPLQRILWRDAPDEDMRCLQLSRVTYGTAAASFLATRTLLQLVENEGQKYPLASRAIELNSYVDDIITGANDFETAMQLRVELVELLSKGQFELHKWYSNNAELLENIPDEKKEKCHFMVSHEIISLKTLGLIWNPENDEFLFSVPDGLARENPTKRNVLACIAKIFDPLGLIAPIITYAKIVMQMIWREKIGWDDLIPDHILKLWIPFTKNLCSLVDISIPRLIISTHSVNHELHGFSDSSCKAYGCVIYLKSIDANGSITIRLICAKSRVAPLKTISLPKLELCGALLLARLMHTVKNAIALDVNKIAYYTDSLITLAWIQADAARWNVFVANRVSLIQELSPKENWQHISSAQNPADVVSRGLEPQLLKDCQLWWNGPMVLSTGQHDDPTIVQHINIENLPEKRITAHVAGSKKLTQDSNDLENHFQRSSNFVRLQRVFAYVLRFVNNSRNSVQKQTGCLTTIELKASSNAIVRCIQSSQFSREIALLREVQANSEKKVDLRFSKLKFLNPFLDENGVLRVGGRLRYCGDSMKIQKYPIILSAQHHVVTLLIKFEHERLLHAGPQATLSSLRQRFWIVGGRNATRKVVSRCMKCYRFTAKPNEQFMANLPSVRVTPARPFLHAGLDYAGPIMVKQSRVRKAVISKGYICLFICMVTKAIHLELVSDMSTKTFLAALSRFFSRRGKSAQLFSDNGTNFKGAHRDLNELYKLLTNKTSSEVIINSMSKEGVGWNFIPPSSPHWGGLWESGVKGVKHHLKRILGNALFTYEELNTLLVQIEGVLNSRPLCPLGNEPEELECLTPAHFLINDSITNLPETNFLEIPINRLTVWEHIKKLKQIFWKRWQNEYLHGLHQRYKWHEKTKDMVKGAVVLVREDGVPPLQWCLARIIDVFPGKDGHVRAVLVKSKNGEYRRPITKISPLPLNC